MILEKDYSQSRELKFEIFSILATLYNERDTNYDINTQM